VVDLGADFLPRLAALLFLALELGCDALRVVCNSAV
jgi:hypothetical protein